MWEYTDGIERINIELSLRNKLKLCDALTDFFQHGDLPLGKQDDAGDIPSAELLERSEEHTSELQSQSNLVCRLLLEKKKHINSILSCKRGREPLRLHPQPLASRALTRGVG